MRSPSFAPVVILFFLFFGNAAANLPIFTVHKQEHRSLENVSVRCCMLESESLVTRKGETYVGFSVDMFALLQQETGIKCSETTDYTVSSGSAYNHFITYLANCTLNPHTSRCENLNCEIGIGGWWQTEDRTGVDFLPPHGYDSFTVVTHIDNLLGDYEQTFMFDAFHMSVWFAIAGLVLFFVVIRICDNTFRDMVAERDREKRRTAGKSYIGKFRRFLLKNPLLMRLRKSTKSTMSKMINYQDDVCKDETTRQWTLSMVIAISGLFLVLVYEAGMTAKLVQEKFTSGFQSIEDFENCRIADSEICMMKGDAIQLYWDSIQPLRDVNCPSNYVKQGHPQKVESHDELFDKTMSKACKYTLTDGGAGMKIGKGAYCRTLQKVGTPFLLTGISFVVPKNWAYTERLRVGQLRVTRQNPKLTLQDYDTGSRNRCRFVETTVGFRKLRLFFYCSYAVCVVLFLYMILDPKRDLDGVDDIDDSESVVESREEGDIPRELQ